MTQSPETTGLPFVSTLVVKVIACLLIFIGAFAAVRYWLPGPELTLLYLRALVWPVVVTLLLFFLRERLVEKFQQLVEAAGWGLNLRFQEQKAWARTATAEESLVDALEEDAKAPSSASDGPAGVAADAATDQVPHVVADKRAEAAAPSQPTPEYVAAMKKRLAELSESREAERRTDVEKAFKEGAAWGWDLAGIGLKTRPVPEFHWTSEGKPEITYQSRPARQEAASASKNRILDRLASQGERMTRVRRLEEEIRILEIKDAGPTAFSSAVSDESMGRKKLIQRLKKQLRDLDPTSPYAR